MAPATPRHTSRLFFAVALAWLFACSSSGTGGGGCGGMTPIPGGKYTGAKTNNAVNLRLSPQGINYINTNWKTLVETFAPGQKINFPFACQVLNVGFGLGDVTVADQGGPSGGQMDGVCDGKDLPRNVDVTLTGFNLAPTAPDKVTVTLSVNIATGKIYASTTGGVAYCFGGRLHCSIDFNSSFSSPTTNTIKAEVKFTIDTKWDQLLAFEVTKLDGTQICGASGAPSKPMCIDPSDLSIAGENTCGDVYCGVADWDFVKNTVLGLASSTLQTRIKEAIAKQSCQACGTGLPACPQIPPSAASTCDSAQSVCMDGATSKCVPRFLGVEGRVSPASFLGSFGVPSSAALDLSVAAGSSVKVDQGISLGTRGGLQAAAVADCVPALAPPPQTAVPAPDFDADAKPAAAGYHVGLGISQPFLDLAMFHAHQSGTLCVNVNASTVGLMTTGLFKTFLPSLGKLATRDGKDAPMMIVLRPARAPTITVGEGTYDSKNKPVKPLILLKLTDLTIDFYAMLDDRYARIFSLTADIALPLSLIFNGCSSVQPAIGDLNSLITNIRTANAEMLAEDPKVLSDLVPAVIGFAEPAVAGALKPFDLPQLGSFKLKVNSTQGVGNIAGTEAYNHLGIYATLMPTNAVCASMGPRTEIALKRTIMPKAEEMRATGNGIPWPTAVLDARALGMEGTPSFSYRVDGGLWTDFVFTDDDHELVIKHPLFIFQGLHTIEVMSRMEEAPHGVSPVAKLGFLVDYEAPEVKLTVDRAAGRITVAAHDQVTPDEKLEYAYQVGAGPLSAFGPARPIDLAAIEQQGGVTVQVRDEAGHVGQALHRVAKDAVRANGSEAISETEGQAAGCSASGGAIVVGALALLAGLLVRRARQAVRVRR